MFLFAGDINLQSKHCCATLDVFTQLTVTCSSTTHDECIVVFSLQKLLRERATVLRYTYIAQPVEEKMSFNLSFSVISVNY
jgi:hypothetical protein